MHLIWTMIWKEWLGLRWKLAALGAIPLGMLVSLLLYDATYLAPGLVAVIIGYGAVAPLFMAMHAAAEERSSDTLEFVRGLPVTRFQLGLVRVLTTLAVLLTPLIVTSALVYLLIALVSWWNPAFNFDAAVPNRVGLVPALVLLTALGMTIAASLYLWTTALAMNQPSELRAGLIGIATLVIWGAATMASVSQWDNGSGNWTWMYSITSTGPFASLIMYDPGLTVAGRVAVGTVHVLAMCLLAVVAANRYGALEPRRWVGPLRLSNANRALWWLQWRQAWPLGIAGLVTVIALYCVGLAVSRPGHANALHFQTLIYSYSMIIGVAWAIIVGATMFTSELEPRLAAFWRSRPIDPSSWFRTKFIAGLLALVVSIDLPAACLGAARDASPTSSYFAYLACVPALHLAVFSLAVATACIVRHSTYAGILSLAATLFFVVLPMIVPKRGFLSAIDIDSLLYPATRDSIDFNPGGWLLKLAIYLSFTLLVTIIAIAVAHWAVQKDIAVRA